MKLGLVLAVFAHLPLERALQKAAELGYEAVEIGVEARGGHLDPRAVLDDREASRVRALVARHGLTISALGNHAEGQLVLGPHHQDTDGIFAGTPDEKVRHGVERMKLTARAAAALEVPVVCGFCGCEDYSRWFPWPDEKAWERMSEAFVERWSDVLDTFREVGVRFAHEPHPKQFAYNTETAEESVRLLGGRPEWGFNLDPANLMLAGVDPVVFVHRLGDRVLHVHAKDGELVAHNIARSGLLAHGSWARIDRGFRFRVPGWGSLDWKRLVTELRLVGFDGVLAVEHEDPTMSRLEGAEKGRDHLRPLLLREPVEEPWW